MVWVGTSFHILGGEVRTEKRLMVAFSAQLTFGVAAFLKCQGAINFWCENKMSGKAPERPPCVRARSEVTFSALASHFICSIFIKNIPKVVFSCIDYGTLVTCWWE